MGEGGGREWLEPEEITIALAESRTVQDLMMVLYEALSWYAAHEGSVSIKGETFPDKLLDVLLRIIKEEEGK